MSFDRWCRRGPAGLVLFLAIAALGGRAWIAIPTFTQGKFWIDVTDTKTGQSKEYHSLPGNQTLLYDPSFFVFP